MLVLALDTSTRQVTVAIGNEAGVVGSVTAGGPASSGPPRHTETLAPAIAELMRITGVAPGELTAVGVGIGPGMFTGLRAGVVTATMCASALGLPVAPIPSLDVIAQPLLAVTSGLVVAIVDARRAEVFHATYRASRGNWTRVADDAVGRPADVASALAANDEAMLLCGDAATRVHEQLADTAHVALAGPAFATPAPTALVALTCDAVARDAICAPADVRPRYLRKSDAEINADIRSERGAATRSA